MKLNVTRAHDGVITVRLDRPGPALSPEQVTTAVARAVGAVLQAAPPVVSASPERHGVGEGAPGVLDVDEHQAVEDHEHQAVEDHTMSGVVGRADTAAVAAATGGGSAVIAPAERDTALRRQALALLDEGLPDAQVCARLRISRATLLRFDDPLTGDGAVDEAVWREDARVALGYGHTPQHDPQHDVRPAVVAR